LVDLSSFYEIAPGSITTLISVEEKRASGQKRGRKNHRGWEGEWGERGKYRDRLDRVSHREKRKTKTETF
jgi:hypothetical protein